MECEKSKRWIDQEWKKERRKKGRKKERKKERKRCAILNKTKVIEGKFR